MYSVIENLGMYAFEKSTILPTKIDRRFSKLVRLFWKNKKKEEKQGKEWREKEKEEGEVEGEKFSQLGF